MWPVFKRINWAINVEQLMNYKMGNQRSGLAHQRLRGNMIEKTQGRAGTIVPSEK